MARSAEERKADLLKAVQERDGLVIATGPVADAADVSKPTARKYLEELEEEGKVVEEELAGRMHVWYTPEVLEYGLGAFAGEDPPDPPDDGTAGGADADAEVRAAGGPAVEQREPAGVLETVEELEETVFQLRQDIADLDDDNADDGGEGPYAHVRSPARRWALKERQRSQNFGVSAATGFAAGFIPYIGILLVTPPGATVPVVGASPGVLGAYILGFAFFTFTLFASEYVVLTLLLRFRVLEWADRTLPFRPDPDDATAGGGEAENPKPE